MANKVNKYPIINATEVFLACPNCGEDMKKDDPPSTWDKETYAPTYRYICLHCNIRATSKVPYPCQQVTFDKSKKICENEDIEDL